MASKNIRLATAASVALAALLLYRSHQFFPYTLEFAVRALGLFSRLALLSIALLGWGSLLHRALAGREARLSIAAGWALGGAGTATVMGFLAPIWYPNSLFLAPWLAAGVAIFVWRRARFDYRIEIDKAGLWLLSPFAVCATLLALAPPVSLDALVYHLAIPKQFALQGQAFEMPWNLHSYFPQHVELLFGLTLELDATGVLGQLLHLCAAFLTVATVARTGTREFGRLAGTLAAIALVSIPTYCLISGWAWNDWFVLLYCALGLDRILALRTAPDRREYLVAATFLGSAAAVKYNALPLLALLALGFSNRYRRLLPAAVLILVALLGPWYGKNLLQKQNPVYPLFSAAHGAGSFSEYRGDVSSAERWLGYLGRRDMVDESLGLLWIAALPLGLAILVRDPRRLWPLGLVAALYLGTAVVLHPTIRAFGPLFLVGSWLGGAGLAALAGEPRRRRVIYAILAALLLISLSQVLWVLRHYEPLGVTLGFTSRETYLETGQDYYSAYRWLGANSGEEAVVLVVGESRIFYLDRPAIAASYLDQPVLSGFLPEAAAGTAARSLREAGITHLLVNWSRLRVAVRRPPTTNELLFTSDPGTDAALKELVTQSAREVFRQGPIQVYVLETPGG